MENLIKNKIISQAIGLGFDFEQFSKEDTLEEVNQSIIDFFGDNSHKLEQLEDECEVRTHGNSQSVSYGEFVSSGEIVDFRQHWHKSPDTKIFHSSFIIEDKDGFIKCMNLYYLVGDTEYNIS